MTDLPPKILFLDAATKFGAAVGRPGERPLSWSGRWAKPGASHGAVCCGCFKVILGMMERHQPDMVVIEKSLPANQIAGRTNDDTITVLKGIPFAIQGFLFLRGFFNVQYGVVGEIRKHFIGANPRGPVGKEKVWQKCVDLGWITPGDVDYSLQDRTDALAGWSYVETQILPQRATPVDDLWVASEKKKREAQTAAIANVRLTEVAERF